MTPPVKIPHDRGAERYVVSAIVENPALLADERVKAFEAIDILDPLALEVFSTIRNMEATGKPITAASVTAAYEARTVERAGHTTGSKHHPELDDLIAIAPTCPPSRVRVHQLISKVSSNAAARREMREDADAAERAQHEREAARLDATANIPVTYEPKSPAFTDAGDFESKSPSSANAGDLNPPPDDVPHAAGYGEGKSESRADDSDLSPEDEDSTDGDENESAGPGRKISQATLLVRMARARAEFWRTPDGDLFASVDVDGHREHMRLASKQFKHWLAHLALVMMDRAAGAGTLRDAFGALEGVARFQGAEHSTFTRIAAVEDRIYIDLCDARWRAVEIDRDGWRIVERPPVRFERRHAMAPLPEPTRGGSIAELRDHVRITDDSWPLVLGWLVGALAPHGPYPVLVLRGQHGAGKSCGARRSRSLIDPSIAPIRSEPREPRDLVISARASHVTAFDNLSSVPPWLSDGLCRLSTGGGYAARALYTDADEIVIDVQRPVILTGITDVVTAPDLLDRSLLVELEAIAPEDRETERRLDARWAAAQPRILGALYTAVSAALARRDEIQLARLPRLADWATWATAAEHALGLEDGAVIRALEGQAEEATEIALDASIIARPICDWIEGRIDPVWCGTAGDLLAALTDRVDLAVSRDKAWPKTARGLAGMLARIAPSLRERGVCVERAARGHGGVRGWRIERTGGRS